MALPEHGLAESEIFDRLGAMATGDKDHRSGRCFSLVFHCGEDHERVVQRAHDQYVWLNALNQDAFPSLRRMSSEVLAIAADLFAGGDAGVAKGLAGFLTSGGTESILCSVKAAIAAGHERGIEAPNVVLPMSAHAAFDKACSYFAAEPRRIPVRPDWRADVDASADACDDDTVLIVGSAPQYPQGVVDPITDLAAIALDRGTSCHVDACMGGFVLPFLADEGLFDQPWDFRVPGVTTISADVHKYGYVPKGVSVVMHRDRVSRRRQTFVFDGWLGGTYASSGMLGTKPGGPIAAAWASVHFLGRAGFREASRRAFEARTTLEAGVRAIPGLTVLGRPDATLLAIAADDGSDVDVFKVMDDLDKRGWLLDRQGPPDSLHATVTPAHRGEPVQSLLADLRAAVDDLGGATTADRSTRYATLE